MAPRVKQSEARWHQGHGKRHQDNENTGFNQKGIGDPVEPEQKIAKPKGPAEQAQPF